MINDRFKKFSFQNDCRSYLEFMLQTKQLSCNNYREKAYGVVRGGFWNYWIFRPKDPESELEVSR